MTEKQPLYITTTLPYVNADPHIGFALEAVQADVIARSARALGREVFFNMGTDEHGQKVFVAAQKEGKETNVYVDWYATRFQELTKILNLSNDAFIRTTDQKHIHAAQEIWRRCEERGDIEKRAYKGLYCVGCERFVQEKDLVDGKCQDHNKEPELLEEENYFFKLSKYADELRTHLQDDSTIIPAWRRKEALELIEGGLEDISISRERARLPWGIPVPNDESQVMYVWFDALTNYISTLGWPDDTEGTFKKFWEGGYTLQLAGKDQVRFQSIIWQAMLLSAGIKHTDTVLYHGFITSNGKKMSKSIGNVINPIALVEKYGTDALRFFLLKESHPFEDSDFTIERFHEMYTAHLVNGIGNLTSRILKMAEDNRVEIVLPHSGDAIDGAQVLERFAFNEALSSIWTRIQGLDMRITNEEPFKVVKSDPEKGKKIILELITELWRIGCALAPFLPDTSEKIISAIKVGKKPAPLFERKELI